MQQQLCEKGSSPKPKSLIITKPGKEKLSKNQEAFNKLTQKIEKLQKDIEKKQFQFDLALKIYAADLFPAKQNLLKTRYKFIIVLWGIYSRGKLSKTDQRELKNIVKHHLQEYFTQLAAEPDIAIQNIFSAIEGISYKKRMQQEKDEMATAMQEIFDNADLDIDMDGVDVSDEDAMAKKMAEAKQKIEAQEEEWRKKHQKNKKKTNKQVEYEKMQQAVAETKHKNISTIYRQLAKLFHPDLEQDTGRKVEKEMLMKELIAAYEAKNLHALLSLELKWIHKENDHLETLTEEKLAVYLQILKEQAMELEFEKSSIAEQPQYFALVKEFGFSIQRSPVETVKQCISAFMEEDLDLKNFIANLESDMALRCVKEMIMQNKKQQQPLDEVAILRMLYG